MKTNTKTVPILAAISYLVMIAVNSLANVLYLGGTTTGAVSDAYTNLFAPAGITFSIWGLIYFLLALHTISILITPIDSKTTILYMASSLVNCFWLVAWHTHLIGLSLVLMLVLLYLLIRINKAIHNLVENRSSYILLKLPFSIYLGWISVATIANVTVFLVSLGFRGWLVSEEYWTAFILLTGVAVAFLWVQQTKDRAYLITFLWAYTGILIKHTSEQLLNNQYPIIITTVVICLMLLLARLVITYRTFKQV